MPIDLRAVRKFTGTWSSYMHHAAVSSPSYLGTSQKGKSHELPKKNLRILYFSITYHNNISLYVGVLDVMIIHNSGIRFKDFNAGSSVTSGPHHTAS